MKRTRIVFACLVLYCSSVLAQTPAKLAFEVASIKPLPSLQALIADLQSGKQLGLKLDSRKAPVDMLIIDSIEKTPTEN